MKKFFTIPLLILLCTTLCSCPYSSPFKLDDTPNMYVDETILGKWATFVKRPGTEREEPVKMILTRKNEMEYHIAFTGDLDELRPFHIVSSDSLIGTAFMSEVESRRFLNINIKSKIYIAELKFRDDHLSIMPLSEHFTGKMIFNNTALRNSVAFHYKSRVRPVIDEDFCLMDMVRVN